jgi:hypothetical protein
MTITPIVSTDPNTPHAWLVSNMQGDILTPVGVETRTDWELERLAGVEGMHGKLTYKLEQAGLAPRRHLARVVIWGEVVDVVYERADTLLDDGPFLHLSERKEPGQ